MIILFILLMYVMMKKSCKQEEFISVIVPRHSRYSAFTKGYKVRSSRGGKSIKYDKCRSNQK